jgi:hypothetical protein
MYGTILACDTATYNKRNGLKATFASFCYGCEFAKNNLHGNIKVGIVFFKRPPRVLVFALFSSWFKRPPRVLEYAVGYAWYNTNYIGLN